MVAFSLHTSIAPGWSIQRSRRYDRFTVSTNAARFSQAFTRSAERVNAWENLAAFVETVKRSYRRDRWIDQPGAIEVWSEKATISGTLRPVLDTYGITFRVMHGY